MVYAVFVLLYRHQL